MSRPRLLSGIPHRVQKLITATEINVLPKLAGEFLLDALPAPRLVVSAYRTRQPQHFGVAQEGGCPLILVALILNRRQAAFVVGVNDFVCALVTVLGDPQGVSRAAPFGQKSQQLTSSSFYCAGAARVDLPEVLGFVVEVWRFDSRIVRN